MSPARTPFRAWAIVAALACGAVAVIVTQRRGTPSPQPPPAIATPQTMPAAERVPSPPPALTSGVDLNSASLEQLEALPGLTPDYARRIVAGRPFRDRSEVVGAGIPPDVLDRISPPAYLKFDLPGGIPSR